MCREVYVTGTRSDAVEIGKFVASLESTGAYKQRRRWFSSAPPRDPADLEAVESAQLVIAVMTDPEHEYAGVWSEVRRALKCKIPVVIIGPDTTDAAHSLLWHDPRIQHARTPSGFVRALNIELLQIQMELYGI